MKRISRRRGAYVDSVTLMQVSRRVASLDGVGSALVAMATDLNLDLAAGMGFEVPEVSPNEMLVAIDAESEEALARAEAEVETALTEASRPAAGGGFGGAPEPVTVRAAAARSGATVALISTPGQHAFADAVDAVDANLLTMVFSDNVPLEQEVALKEYADEKGVLVMGPDCGTAIIGGVGLGFANVVRPGPVGIVAASGTGAQHLMSLLDGAGVGISHCLGVGGRDLSEEVAGRSTMRALDLLADDDQTEVVVVVSKPPAPAVADRVRARAAGLGKPMVLALLGPGQPDLTGTARSVAEAAGASWVAPQHWPGAVRRGRGGALRGLFAGGTLCEEAMIIAADRLGAVHSNVPLDPGGALDADLTFGDRHAMLDLGDDRFTRGRPHPMIDGSTRVDLAGRLLRDPTTSVLMLDVVLGLGAAPDPAGELEATLRNATGLQVPVVVSVVGTRDDPQGLDSQIGVLLDAGAWVCRSNAEAARAAVDLVTGGTP
jgi:FdrA protein